MNRALALLPLLLASACGTTRTKPVAAPAAPAIGAEAARLFERGDLTGALAKYRAAWDHGDHTSGVTYGAASVASRLDQRDEAFVWLDRLVDVEAPHAAALRADPDLANVRKDPRFSAVAAKARRRTEARARDLGVGAGLPRSTPEAEHIDRAALDRLRKAAQDSGSAAIIVLRHGNVVVEDYFGGYSDRIEAMSATKSVVALAIGMLVREGRIKSLDEPVWRYFPEWRQGKKEKITLRMILSHTSGLQAGRTTQDIYRSPDFVRFALAADVADEPGTTFFYNNKAVNLLAGVVERASGQKLDDYVKAHLFAPLGIHDVEWTRDDAQNPHGMAGLQIHPIDFAKIGQLMLNGGKWNERTIVDPAFIAESTRPAQPFDPTCGLLWWLAFETETITLPAVAEAALTAQGVPPSIVEAFHDYYGRAVPADEWMHKVAALKLDDYARFFDGLQRAKLRLEHTASGPVGFAARGYLGQIVLVIPSLQIVAVRMVEAVDGERSSQLGFAQFVALVRSLAK